MRLALVLSLVVLGCAKPIPTQTHSLPQSQVVAAFASARDAFGVDTFEVWVCEVPADVADPIYEPSGQRLELVPEDIADQLNQGVTRYFQTLSHGQYEPRFVAGNTLQMSAQEGHDQCVERALAASSVTTDAVLVVANAEHRPTKSGGWGRSGSPCAGDRCPAQQTGRAAYVGGSDFDASWGDRPALDLIEHEIGHTLGLVHSGGADGLYDSALDVMSNSAAPRMVDPQRRDGPDTLAIQRFSIGWLPAQALAVAPPGGGEFELLTSAGTAGERLLLLPVSDAQALTVEFVTNTGLNDVLPESGVAIHLIDLAMPDLVLAVGDSAPYTDLLDQVGDTVDAFGWTITLRTSAAPNVGSEPASPTIRVDAVPTVR